MKLKRMKSLKLCLNALFLWGKNKNRNLFKVGLLSLREELIDLKKIEKWFVAKGTNHWCYVHCKGTICMNLRDKENTKLIKRWLWKEWNQWKTKLDKYKNPNLEIVILELKVELASLKSKIYFI